MQSKNHISRLTEMAERYGKLLAEQEGVLGVVISGSIARGDIWEGSDVDLHVLLESEGFSPIGGFVDGIFINVHDVPVGYMEYITGDMEEFCRDEIPDQLYKCRIIHDPRGLWAKYKSIIDSNRFRPEIIAGKVDFYIRETRRLLSIAENSLELDDPASAVFHAQRAAVKAAFGGAVKCGDLIRSANRFPENLKLLAEKHALEELYKRFRQVHGLTGGMETAEKVVIACESTPRIFAIEIERVSIPMDSLRKILGNDVFEDLLRRRDYPDESIKWALHDDTPIKCGYYDGKVIWMRTTEA